MEYCAQTAVTYKQEHECRLKKKKKRQKPAGLFLVSVIHVKLRRFEMNFQNVNKIYNALKHLVLSTPKYKYLLKRKTRPNSQLSLNNCSVFNS